VSKFNTVKTIGYGLFLWLIITALIGAVYGFGIYFEIVDSPWVGFVAALVAWGTGLIFAQEMGVITLNRAWAVGLVWLLIPLALDLIIIAQFTNEVFNSWQYWFGHALVFLSPLMVYHGGRKN
jgi:hypothetical protein